MALTDRQIQNAKAIEKDLFLRDDHGLYLRARPSGNKTWLYRYKLDNKQKWLDLGLYPTVSLSNARLEAQKAKAQRKDGVDPASTKQQLKASRIAESARLKARISVTELFNRWEKLELCNHKNKGVEIRRMFEKDVLPTIGAIPVEDVKKAHVSKVVDAILERGVDRTARMILALMRQMFRFAQDRDIIEVDPTATIRKSKIGKPDIPRDRYLPEAEIKELHQKIPTANLNISTQAAIYIALSTGCRIGELLKAQWKEVDLATNTWLIPAENSKNGVAMTIFLSDFATRQFEILQSLGQNTIWCYPNRDEASHVCEKTIAKQVYDRQLPNDRKPMKNRSKHAAALTLSGGKWTPHDLRRTAATLMTALGVLPDIADKCLNHKDQKRMQRVYQLHNYDAEKKLAWKLLGERLDLLTGVPRENVVIGKFGITA
jgi:integrase